VTALIHFKNTVVLRWRSLDESWRYAITVFLIARLLFGIWSWVVFTIQPVAVQNLELRGEPVLTIFSLRASQAYVYHREVNGEILSFIPNGSNHLADRQTGSLWNLSNGKAIQGQYSGSTLAQAKTSVPDIFPYHGATPYPGIWLALWQRFDANWYGTIAEKGYGSIPGDDHFPPLFPILIRGFMPLAGNAFLAGLLISHVATFLSIKLLYDTFSQWGERSVGKRAVLFFVIYPTFFFLFSAYSESVFLLAALLSLQAMRKRSWLWAGFWIFCATLTRLQGVALLAPLLFLLWQDRPVLQKPAHWFGPVLAGMGGLFYLFGRSMQGINETVPLVESDWHARLVPPWQTYGYAVQTILSGKFSFIDFLNWVVVTLFIILLVWGWRKIPLEYNLYTTASLLIILIRIVETQPLISMSRYSLTLFPTFYVLGLAGENPYIRRVILYGSILLALYLSAQFFLWGWVA
jgi:hypothetical protein